MGVRRIEKMRTTKLYLAAALMSLGAGLADVDKSDPRHMEFVLVYSSPVSTEEEWFESRKALWDKRELLVNGQEFVDAIQELKSEVHQ
jgi:hypothetical protein